MANGSGKINLGISGGGYIMIAFGVGLASGTWGVSFIPAVLNGLFWPGTVAYWLIRALQQVASSGGVS